LLLVITIFAILGVQLFAGKLHFCTDGSVHDKASCAGVLPGLKYFDQSTQYTAIIHRPHGVTSMMQESTLMPLESRSHDDG
jgi:hypothetical protein